MSKVAVLSGREAREVARHLLPRIFVREGLWRRIVPNATGVYYRAYRNEETGEYAVLYLFTWESQSFPPHEHDYEPVVVIADERFRVKEVYTDKFHYFVGKYSPSRGSAKRVYLLVENVWRSMSGCFARRSLPREAVEVTVNELGGLRQLTDYHLKRMRSRTVNPLAVNEAIIRNPFVLRDPEVVHWATLRSPSPADLWRDLAKNVGLPNVAEKEKERLKC